METQEAIEILERQNSTVCHNCIHPQTVGWCENHCKLPKAFDMAVDALKKQIPTPIIIENGFVKCTECGKYIRFPLIDKYNNCPECGQAIDWRQGNERD